MDKNIIFWDTETTGLPVNWKAPMTSLENWPRIIQLAWGVYTPLGELVSERCVLIRPDGWEIPNEHFWIENGFTTDGNQAKGIPMKNALLLFIKDMEKCQALVAHNEAFDYPVTGAEMIRYGMRSKVKLPRLCTMQASIDYCKLPGQYGWKYPKLEELHFILFGTNMEGAHDAGSDTRACAKCFFKLRELGLI